MCRERDAIAALAHVAAAISEYADATTGYELWRAAGSGSLTLLQRVHGMCTTSAGLLQSSSSNAIELTLEAATANGHLHIVQWLHETFPERKNKTWAIDTAAENGHLAIMQWLHATKSMLDRASMAAMDEAARNGRLDIVQWLHDNRSEGCSTRAMDCAARNGHLHIVQWLHANRTEGCTTQAMDWAAAQGHLNVVQWLHEHRREGCSSMAIDNAAANGYLHVVKWLHQHCALKWTSNAECNAAARGHEHVLDWLRCNAIIAAEDARCHSSLPLRVSCVVENSDVNAVSENAVTPYLTQ